VEVLDSAKAVDCQPDLEVISPMDDPRVNVFIHAFFLAASPLAA
jgi:hypothetical protein